MIIQIVKFQTGLSDDEVIKVAEERAAQFRTIPGLLQKYYVRAGQPGRYAGIYLWDSIESLSKYRASDLAVSIPQAYKILGPPEVEIFEVAFQLRG